jgi:hypothetical protein
MPDESTWGSPLRRITTLTARFRHATSNRPTDKLVLPFSAKCCVKITQPKPLLGKEDLPRRHGENSLASSIHCGQIAIAPTNAHAGPSHLEFSMLRRAKA